MGRLAYFFVSIMYFLGIGFILAVFCSESILKFFDYVIDTKDASQNPDNS
jgi:archaellum biogenesis protein FlaJ (TadC family)